MEEVLRAQCSKEKRLGEVGGGGGSLSCPRPPRQCGTEKSHSVRRSAVPAAQQWPSYSLKSVCSR